MKDLSSAINTNQLSSKIELTYELVHVDSMLVLLTESVPKSKKTNQSRFYKRSKF